MITCVRMGSLSLHVYVFFRVFVSEIVISTASEMSNTVYINISKEYISSYYPLRIFNL